jgi:hypothetical protein
MYVTPYIAALLSLSSQDSVSEDHPRGTVISRQNSTVQAKEEFSDVSLGTKPDIVIEV